MVASSRPKSKKLTLPTLQDAPAPAATPVAPPAPASEPILSTITLHLYTLRVLEEAASGIRTIVTYWVEAPTQCSAVKHTALIPEVAAITYVELYTGTLPDGEVLTFTTTSQCP
jgi:hypothetical protein